MSWLFWWFLGAWMHWLFIGVRPYLSSPKLVQVEWVQDSRRGDEARISIRQGKRVAIWQGHCTSWHLVPTGQPSEHPHFTLWLCNQWEAAKWRRDHPEATSP